MKMRFTLAWYCLTASWLVVGPNITNSCRAQTAEGETQGQKIIDPTGGLRVEATLDRTEYRVIKLRPRLVEVTAKSRLFPDRSDMKPGNAAPIFLRQNFEATTAMEQRKKFYAEEPGPLERRLNDPQLLEVEQLGLYRVAELERGAYRDRAGWEYPLYEPEYEGGGLQTMLPDVQEFRICSLYLCELARASIVRGNLSQAERYLRTGLGLTRHLSDTPFMVVQIVSAAQCRYFQTVIEELIQHPDAPNYYWDLTSIPRPMIDTRATAQWEWNILSHAYPELKNLDTLVTDQQWQTLYDKIIAGLNIHDGTVPQPGSREFDQLKQAWAKKSKEMLPQLAPAYADRVPQMSDAESSVRYWWIRVQELQNTLFAPALLEPQYVVQQMAEREQKIKALYKGEEFLLASLMPMLTSHQIRYVIQQEQTFGMLRTVEAIRHWSAEHDGQLPDSLAALSLPLPIDPLSGQAYQYQRSTDGRWADLHGKSVPLEDDKFKYGLSYRIEKE